MSPTLEDLDRRVTALELAQSARGDNAIAWVEQKVDALHRVIAELIAETEQRLEAKIAASEQRLGGRITKIELRIDRLDDRIGAAEKRFVDVLNERFDAVMVALDRVHNPPKS
jgi:hypothetical protein